MFQREIDNDLKVVDSTIREYWGLAGAASNAVNAGENKPENNPEKKEIENA